MDSETEKNGSVFGSSLTKNEVRVNSLIYSTYLVFCLFSVFEQPSVCCVCVVVEGRERGESNPKFYIIRKRLSSASRRCPCRDIVPLYHSLTFPVIESHSRAAVSRKRSSQKRERSASTLHTHTTHNWDTFKSPLIQ